METDKLQNGSVPTDIPGLVAQARAAYSQNRIKECLALTRAALLVDPGNTAAIEIQASVRFDMQRDLSDARALIEESRNKPEGQKYRKAAEIILLKALYLDPDSEGAKTLLSSIRSFTESPATAAPAPIPVAAPAPAPIPVAAPAPAPIPAAAPAPAPEPIAIAAPIMPAIPVENQHGEVVWESPASVIAEPKQQAPEPRHETYAPVPSYVTQQELPDPEPIPFTTGTTFVDRSDKKEKRSGLTVPIVIVAIAVLGGGFLLARQHMATVPTASAASTASTGSENVQSRTAVSYPASGSAAPASTPLTVTNAAQTKPTLAALNAPPLPGPTPATPAPAAPAANSRVTPAVTAAATGSLAVSSAIAAEIYMGDKYLGATPTTLQLPAGNQTLEYRHGDLRSVMTHVVKANETTTALVTFDATVVVQAKPWATVFVEGSARVPLGTTPLSGVKLPIGTVLVFENPNFPSKTHKIAIDDKTIQVVFQ